MQIFERKMFDGNQQMIQAANQMVESYKKDNLTLNW